MKDTILAHVGKTQKGPSAAPDLGKAANRSGTLQFVNETNEVNVWRGARVPTMSSAVPMTGWRAPFAP